MTRVQLTTNENWLYPELCDVVRLFLGDVPISETEGDLHVFHTHADGGECWEETASDGEKTVLRRVPACRGGLAEKRTLKRAAKTAVFLLLREKLQSSRPGARSPAYAPRA